MKNFYKTNVRTLYTSFKRGQSMYKRKEVKLNLIRLSNDPEAYSG